MASQRASAALARSTGPRPERRPGRYQTVVFSADEIGVPPGSQRKVPAASALWRRLPSRGDRRRHADDDKDVELIDLLLARLLVVERVEEVQERRHAMPVVGRAAIEAPPSTPALVAHVAPVQAPRQRTGGIS